MIKHFFYLFVVSLTFTSMAQETKPPITFSRSENSCFFVVMLQNPHEIIDIIEEKFMRIDRKFFPFMIPIIDINLCIGLTFKKI